MRMKIRSSYQREAETRVSKMARTKHAQNVGPKSLEQLTFHAQGLTVVEFIERFGGPPETRTPDPLIKSQLLYQLS